MKAIVAITFLVFVAVVYSDTYKTTTYGPSVKCPSMNGENATLLPNPYNCNAYFVCESGDAIAMKCPKGLHFNEELSVCDYPANAKCKEH